MAASVLVNTHAPLSGHHTIDFDLTGSALVDRSSPQVVGPCAIHLGLERLNIDRDEASLGGL